MKKTEGIELFKKYGIKPSFHRLRILQYLIENKNHPTVEQIYTSLHKEIPTLSKTTIYNTLKYFVSKGIVKEIMIEGGEIRYDYSEKPHIHFKCKKCGKIYDILKDCDVLSQREIDGHRVEECHIYFIGICKNCSDLERKKK